MATFKEAFREARGEGAKTFEWNGKKYTTELASSSPAKDDGSNDRVTAARAKRDPVMDPAFSKNVSEAKAAKKSADSRRVAPYYEAGANDNAKRSAMRDAVSDMAKKEAPETLKGDTFKQGGMVRRGYGKARGA